VVGKEKRKKNQRADETITVSQEELYNSYRSHLWTTASLDFSNLAAVFILPKKSKLAKHIDAIESSYAPAHGANLSCLFTVALKQMYEGIQAIGSIRPQSSTRPSLSAIDDLEPLLFAGLNSPTLSCTQKAELAQLALGAEAGRQFLEAVLTTIPGIETAVMPLPGHDNEEQKQEEGRGASAEKELGLCSSSNNAWDVIAFAAQMLSSADCSGEDEQWMQWLNGGIFDLRMRVTSRAVASSEAMCQCRSEVLSMHDKCFWPPAKHSKAAKAASARGERGELLQLDALNPKPLLKFPKIVVTL
jgi:hypothetical protein